MSAEKETLARLFRETLEQVARAESFTMADWLAQRPDGRTVKAAYAEAARRVWEMDRQLGGPAAGTLADSPPRAQPRDREHRPVLIVARELKECLSRIKDRVDMADERQSAAMHEALLEVRSLLIAPFPPADDAHSDA